VEQPLRGELALRRLLLRWFSRRSPPLRRILCLHLGLNIRGMLALRRPLLRWLSRPLGRILCLHVCLNSPKFREDRKQRGLATLEVLLLNGRFDLFQYGENLEERF